MATTTRDIVTPDTLARASRSLEAISDSELLGEKLTINMGPSHPATHGVLRIVLELDGEIITKADPDVGYLHRGDEKIAENMQYNQFVPYTDRSGLSSSPRQQRRIRPRSREIDGLGITSARESDSSSLL